MLNHLKVCGGAALTLFLSALVIAPTEAKPVSEVNMGVSYPIAELDNDQSIQRVYYPVGIVRTIEGNTVTLQLANGETRIYQVSPNDMQTWKLYTGSYVLVDNNNNKILDTVYKGEIKSIVGTVVTVKLDNGDLQKYGVDRRGLGAMNLIEGQDLYVTKSQILALAPEPDVNREVYFINNIRPVDTYQDTQVQQTQTPNPIVENNQSQNTDMNQPGMYQDQQRNSSDTQTYPQDTQSQDQPVRGMW
ncbi:hypothetical protein [Gloeothece verrucosa]|uniref:Uncharacterized protein n=1 Tax=Gloeothece verrucosa (strain PCC 7822) TaxID=497965 RepID=E0U7X7_GLOV7|nr:hypothetical protein [Gloeothece verrucosa]ADN16064.1 hypothetical protein Cyan7822_4146 [Gloeothece verrucosa PCC 7822]